MLKLLKKIIFKTIFKTILFFVVFLLSFHCGEKNERADFASKRLKLRAYEGAPPVIPHTILKSGTHYCLSCHTKGIVFEKDAEVWSKKNMVAKITPHPEWVNCFQCHVPQQDTGLFHKNKFKTFHLAHVKKNIKSGEEPAPPPMPHQVENREKCIICHLSKTADPSIVPKHGMRDGCEMCHLPPESLDIYLGDGE
ncbi:MAG: nitrate reductase cytochrome c-type subunit [Spirochaetia bacterium]|nr:nitrate reductase cytochrome c-type subunit [Spirochaetia bacterium]